jgi:aryl-alcohol dehydrogenase-like predicted oxidoreductase
VLPQRKLGPAGISASAVGMGCMPLSSSVNRPPEQEAVKTLHAALEAGISFFDTADAYCLNAEEKGHNERLLAKALKHRPDVVIATKGGRIRPEGRWVAAARPEDLRRACEDSVRALETEAITLYQLHWPDPNVSFAETIGELANLRREGKIVHIGLSNVSLEQLNEARSIVEIVSVQNRMNLFDRSSEGMLRHCAEIGLAFLPYSPLNGKGGVGQLGEHEVITRIAAEYEASPQQIALAWLLQVSPVIIPIPGAGRSSSIVSSAQSTKIKLSQSHIAELDKLAEANEE